MSDNSKLEWTDDDEDERHEEEEFTCESCWGSGKDKFMPDGMCDRCHGEGVIRR